MRKSSSSPRTITQVAASPTGPDNDVKVLAVAHDGSLWEMTISTWDTHRQGWKQVAPLPSIEWEEPETPTGFGIDREERG